MHRCTWAQKEIFHDYHDKEWCVPNKDDRYLFELLILEGAQAGLSWETILKRRKTYQAAYKNFDPKTVAKFTQKDKDRLLADPGIIRNRLKVEASIINANAFTKIQQQHGSFANYIWSFVNNKPILNKFKSLSELPASTPLSDKISKDLKKHGFKFVGSTIIYAYLQAIGIVNDHEISCFRYKN